MDKCNCGNLYSNKCVEKKCKKCCKADACDRHNPIEIEQPKSPSIRNKVWKENLDKICYKITNVTNIPAIVVNNIIGKYIDELFICIKCGHSEEIEELDDCHMCAGCEQIFCSECDAFNSKFIKCKTEDCLYCRRGKCFNNRFGDEYCETCFSGSDSESDIEIDYKQIKMEGQLQSELTNALKKVKLTIRKDSKLCKQYIEGTLNNGMDIDDVVQRMCEMKFLYDYCDMNKCLIRAEKSNDKEFDAGYFPDTSVFDLAEMFALEKHGGKYPDVFPWLVQ